MSVKRAVLAGVVKDLRKHVENLRDEGVRVVETTALPKTRGAAPAAAIPAPRPVAGKSDQPRVAAVAAPVKKPALPTEPLHTTRNAGATNVAPRNIMPEAADPALAGVAAEMQRLAGEVAACRICVLHKQRTNTVPGQGNLRPQIMFIGEAPGADEDAQGLAFVGRSGQLLTQMILAMGFTREQIFIANICKCRPPDNRQPLPEEMTACLPFLRRQIAALHPTLIVALGATAVKGLLGPTEGISKLRGTWCDFEGIPVMPTYHPAYLLRNPPAKHEVWADLQAVLKRLGRTAPAWTKMNKGA